MKQISLLRVYDAPELSPDTYSVLIDRLWPRGVSKNGAPFVQWWKAIAPSRTLRQWYGHDASKWSEFKEKYLVELANNPETDNFINEINKHPVICLMTATKKLELSHGKILLEIINTNQ